MICVSLRCHCLPRLSGVVVGPVLTSAHRGKPVVPSPEGSLHSIFCYRCECDNGWCVVLTKVVCLSDGVTGARHIPGLRGRRS